MEVTRDNFEEAFIMIESAVRSASFVSIDLEFSGLNTFKSSKQSFLDSLEKRFEAGVETVEHYFMLQLGLCAFEPAPDGSWTARPFSIYCFPSHDEERHHCVQPLSIHFLASHGFDFNKAFAHGVGWLSRSQEKLRLQMLDRVVPDDDHNNGPPIVPTADRDIAFVANIRSIVDALLTPTTPITSQSPFASQLDLPPPSKPSQALMDAGVSADRFVITRPVRNRFLRRLLHETIRTHYEGRVASIGTEGDRIIIAVMTQQESLNFRKQVRDGQVAELKRQTGLRRVFDLLSSSEVAIVGHNAWLDLLYVWKCVTGDSEGSSLQGFMRFCHQYFPGGIYDTKYCAKASPDISKFPGTGLDELWEFLRPTGPNIRSFPPLREQAHDAAFDAFATGGVFLSLAGPLCDWRRVLGKHCWRISLHKTEMENVALDGEVKDASSRPHVVALHSFPRQWRQVDVSKAVEAACGAAQLRTIWLGDAACAVVLDSVERAERLCNATFENGVKAELYDVYEARLIAEPPLNTQQDKKRSRGGGGGDVVVEPKAVEEDPTNNQKKSKVETSVFGSILSWFE